MQLQACRLLIDCGVDIACCVLELVNLSSFKNQFTYMWSGKATDKGPIAVSDCTAGCLWLHAMCLNALWELCAFQWGHHQETYAEREILQRAAKWGNKVSA